MFEGDADGNPVTLTIMCPVTGSGPPNITWSAPQVHRTLTGIATTKHITDMFSCEYAVVSVSPGIDQE